MNLRRLFFSHLAIVAFSLLGAGCDMNDAASQCRREGFSGKALEACQTGATLVGPAQANDQDADAKCKQRYTEACGRPEPSYLDPQDPCRDNDLHFIPYPPNAQAWVDRANEMISQYEGCRSGATSHLRSLEAGAPGAGQ